MNRTALVARLALACACTLPGRHRRPSLDQVPGADRYALQEPASRAPGRLEFDQAHDAVNEGRLQRAIELFTPATEKDAGACAHWFDLGAAESNRALEVVNDSDLEAVRLFERGVDHEKEALRLTRAGKCAIWDESTRAIIRQQGEEEIPNAEAMLSEKTGLVNLLRICADARQQSQPGR